VRTHAIVAASRTTAAGATIAGRVLAVDADGFTVGDESGAIRVLAPAVPDLHAIVELTGAVERGPDGAAVFRAASGRLLAPSTRAPRGAKQWERLLADGTARETVRLRARIIAEVRAFFQKRGFLEVDTPSLLAAPGMEPYLDPFETVVRSADGGRARGYLATSPEYALKKLLVAGFERVFEIARCFRNGEGLGGLHNSEFLMLEWYRAYASYEEIMDDTEALLRHLGRSFAGPDGLRCRGVVVRLDRPWERLTVAEAFRRYAAIDLERNLEADSLRRTLRQKGYRPSDDERYEDLFFRVFLNEIEPCLGRAVPTILHDYPLPLAALAKRSERDPRFAERFELYVAGVELANAFTELNDATEQERRFLEEKRLRRALGKGVAGPDQDFLDALRTGMPPAGGIALGLDRLVMLFLGKDRIEDARLFPAADLFAFTKEAKPRTTVARKKKRKKARRT
jgi:lysyl-tRNA synthetase class 2